MGHDAPEYYAPRKRMKGKTLSIFTGFCVVTLPLLLFNIVLIVLIVKYAEPGALERLRSERAIYVDINATTFTTIASWSSTIAPLLGSFIIMLASYPVALNLVRGARGAHHGTTSLPTPYQLAMMLEMRAGTKYRTLWRLLMYRMSSSFAGKRVPLTTPLTTLAGLLILGIILRYVVFLSEVDNQNGLPLS